MSIAEGRNSPFSKNSRSLSSGGDHRLASKTPVEVSISSRSDDPSSVPPEDRTDEGSELEYMGGGTALGMREGGRWRVSARRRPMDGGAGRLGK